MKVGVLHGLGELHGSKAMVALGFNDTIEADNGASSRRTEY